MKNKKGFTLTELMAVIAIISIMMAVAVPTFLGAKAHSEAKACIANLEIILSAEKEWALDNPDIAISGHVITTAEVGPYIDDGWASIRCPITNQNNYVMPAIDINGNIPNPTCPNDADHHL